MTKIIHVDPYETRRRAEYPPIEEQLDAIWKALEAIPNLPPDTAAMLDRIRRIKQDFPKPQ